MIGFLNVNKPQGMSSAQVVALVKKLCPKGTKVGHMGTLDPMATGVLPIAIGRATRLFDLMQDKQKTYIATFRFGYTTDTYDITGQTTAQTSNLPTAKDINNILGQFVGKIQQLPPQYSAKMVGGVRAYDLARKGRDVPLSPCQVQIFDIKLLKDLGQNEYQFEIVCGSGTYIRSLCRDIAQSLGSLGVMASLVRTKTGQFDIVDAINVEDLSLDKIVGVDTVITLPHIDLTQQQLKNLLDGKKVRFDMPDGKYLGYCDNMLQLVLEINAGTSADKIWLR